MVVFVLYNVFFLFVHQLCGLFFNLSAKMSQIYHRDSVFGHNETSKYVIAGKCLRGLVC